MPLRLTAVGHTFTGNPPLFRGIDLTLAPGEIVAVTGPSGSGKSTLLAILAGWLTPSEGRVDRPDDMSVAWIFQNPHGVAQRSALDHVALPIMARGVRRTDAVPQAQRILGRFGLERAAGRCFGQLSGGEAQRLMLARAVAREPDLILADEPTAQLDHGSATSVIEVLRGLAIGGSIVVIATHDRRVCDMCDVVLDLETARSDARA